MGGRIDEDEVDGGFEIEGGGGGTGSFGVVARRAGLVRLLLALRGRLGSKVDEDEAEDREANEAKSEPERLCRFVGRFFLSLSDDVEKGEVKE